MIARVRIVGAITLVQAESNRHFEKADVAFAQDIANRAALYLENSRLFAGKRAAS